MKGVYSSQIPVPVEDSPADNTAAEIALAATARECHVLHKVFGGYDDDPGGEKALTIVLTVNTTEVTLTFPVAGDDSNDCRFDLDFNPPLQGDEGKAMTITLAAGGAGIAGKLNAITN